jgi:predicted small secreted protein
MKWMNLLAAVSVAAALLAGCNTVEGLGKDIRKAGDKIEEVAKRSGDKPTDKAGDESSKKK